jgi:hypothetical protein
MFEYLDIRKIYQNYIISIFQNSRNRISMTIVVYDVFDNGEMKPLLYCRSILIIFSTTFFFKNTVKCQLNIHQSKHTCRYQVSF